MKLSGRLKSRFVNSRDQKHVILSVQHAIKNYLAFRCFTLPFGLFSSKRAAQVPRHPAPGQLVQDYADIISVKDKEEIRKIQYQTFENDDTPICVVTIASKQTFGGGNVSIEKVAHDLFDQWQIGKRNAEGGLINQGILLLVSVGDRKARIELGDDWGRNWDGHCDKIMNQAIVSEFKKGDYSAGILAGVKKLADMGKAGPQGSAPSFSFTEEASEPMLEGINPMPRWAGFLLFAMGTGLIVAGFLIPDFQTPLILTGIGLMLFALLYYWILPLLALFAKGDGDGGSSWSGGGGFSSGGFSGGGGSTGSW